MLISPINNVNPTTNFKSKIKPTNDLKKGFEMAESNINSGSMKNMNYAKDFLDSLFRISESKKQPEFKIEIDKRREDHTYTKINGRRVSGGHNECQQNLQDAYLVIEGTNRYASKLENIEESYLDVLKARITEAEEKLDRLKERYSKQLMLELNQAKGKIF